LLLRVREGSPDESETALAASRAVTAFLRAYASVSEENGRTRRSACLPY
jgi:hypothetical protein